MNLNKIVYLSEAQKNALFESEASNPGHGSITIDGQTVSYNQNDLYITPELRNQSITYKGTITLRHDQWSGSGPWTQTVSIDRATINANTKVDLQPDVNVFTKLINDGVQALFISNDSGDLTAYAIGGRPQGASDADNVTLQVSYYDTF